MTKPRVLLLIVVVSVMARVAAALFLGNTVEALPGTFDQISYHSLALRLLDGHGFSFGQRWWPITAADAPTAHWSYLYTLYLTAVYWVFGPNPIAARLIQAVIVGCLQPVLTWRLGSHIFGERTGMIAAAISAVYIYFIYYAATLMTEPFYIVTILLSLWLLLRLSEAETSSDARRLALALGLSLGMTVLFRQLFLLLIPFFLLWLAWATFRRSRHVPLVPVAIVVGIVALFILPFTAYNATRFDTPVLLNTNAGYAFFWANHPIYETRFVGILPPGSGTYQELIPEELRHLDEAALEQALMERGIRFVLDEPGRYILLSLSRIPVYFKFWPSVDSGLISNISRVASFALFLPFMLGGLAYSLFSQTVRRATWSRASLLWLFMLLYAGVHLASWALIRYRLPIDALLVIYAGLAMSALFDQFVPAGWRLSDRAAAADVS